MVCEALDSLIAVVKRKRKKSKHATWSPRCGEGDNRRADGPGALSWRTAKASARREMCLTVLDADGGEFDRGGVDER